MKNEIVELYLVRHAKTASNVMHRVLGVTDVSLLPEGQVEANSLGEHLHARGVSPEIIYTSPLARAKETAQIIQVYTGGILQESSNLREMDYGLFEGAGREALRRIRYGYDLEKMHQGEGETVDEVETRALDFIKNLVFEEYIQAVAVTHAMIGSILTQILLGLPRDFNHIQAISTGDYSLFTFMKGGDSVKLIEAQIACRNGLLSLD